MKKRLLTTSDLQNLDTRINGSTVAISDLQTRMNTRESGSTALETRMTATETTLSSHATKITTLETRFTAGRVASIAPVTVTPVTPLIDLLGVSVGLGSGVTNLRAAFIELRDAFNLHVERSKQWGWMAA